MNEASTPPAGAGTIKDSEARHFGQLAADWWNPRGSSAMLHRLNPVRLGFVRTVVDEHFGGTPRDRQPLRGRRALDVGCGAGLLSEPLARLGADVTGLDAAAENIMAARAHARDQGLVIDYRAEPVEALGADERFDLVCAMEVIEHVADPALFVRHLARVLSPDGLLVLSTPNRTNLSRLALITVGEGAGLIPRGTHDHTRFVTPDELASLLADVGLKVIELRGLRADPLRGFVLSDDLSLNYLVAAVPA